jgi:uncharacterized protein with PIN domain
VITYFDTSAFVKTVVAEEGSDAAVEIWNSSAIRVTSIVAYAEARAALAAAARSGRLPTGGGIGLGPVHRSTTQISSSASVDSATKYRRHASGRRTASPTRSGSERRHHAGRTGW